MHSNAGDGIVSLDMSRDTVSSLIANRAKGTGDPYGIARYGKPLDKRHVYINIADAEKMNAGGWRWSGHTHTGDPSVDTTIKLPPYEDQIILTQFTKQTLSSIYDMHGGYNIFGKR